MSITYLGYFFIALIIGCGGPVQAGINSTLAKTLGHPLLGAITNTTIATTEPGCDDRAGKISAGGNEALPGQNYSDAG